ncbi:MAG: hypothetical protein HQL11_00295 [Candidatus Omnitrophica bacterium]|nr:hypothetical protein [Candidatus Omnitrophota bacterium]
MHISDRTIHDGKVHRVLLPGVMGEFEVADQHAPIISLLGDGKLVVFPPNEEPKHLKVWQGLMRFDGETLVAVVE